MIHASSYQEEDWAFQEQRLLSEALAQDLMFRRMWGSRTGEAALPPVPFVHYDHHRGWSLSHLWLNYQVKQQSRAKTSCKLFSVIFCCLYPPCQWIHPLGHSRCKTEWMLQFATLSSNFFKTKVSALWHISSIVHQTLWDYLQLWESKKIKSQADRKQRFAHCSQLHHLHPPFDQQSQGTATQNISSSWGMTAHRSWLWSLSLQHTSALTSHKPLMSASLTQPGWELACNTSPSATLLLVPHCLAPTSVTNWHNCRAKCAPKGLSCCLDGHAAASRLQRDTELLLPLSRCGALSPCETDF